MSWHPNDILSTLDACCESFTFPMLDNGYVYLAATRLSLYRSPEDWALVVEVFGFSPRSGIPDTQIYTFASRLRRQKSVADYVTRQAYDSYLASNKHNESTFVYPIEDGGWRDAENPEFMGEQSTALVRGRPVDTAPLSDYAAHDILLQDPPKIYVFEFCRLLAASAHSEVLATDVERRMCVPSELEQIIQLEEWHHPDVVNDERPSINPTFRSLAEVLANGDVSAYKPSAKPNTHWKNWPEGGTL
jgi:hypothetical protein